MKSTKPFLILVLLMDILVLHIVAQTILNVEEETNNNEVDYEAHEEDDDDFGHSFSGAGRSLRQRKGTWNLRLTCKKFPKICQSKGSPGPTCCKKCVDVLKDRMNCGKCGKKCKFNEICCRGKCVNPSFNKKHCGRCGNRCDKGEFCSFGLCNYA
ncbi:stigma-specific STIG1-like protein 1 [Pistacia vera]|uniref:stigma-specific STIG1-like protein 1 n=1 Tax=Pistacia vera TaxID=55513 RepID=UPI0012631330|nr:stigma-specific STIG1-like protein 1 [Pistacia vera]XP_031286496.1 stigma-specific STIG1-like protein 1 [Pistacia vera]